MVESKFPLEEEFVDYSGRPRRFRIMLRKQEVESFFVEARELSQSEGYWFEVYSPIYSVSALGSALGKLRGKIRKSLATRYLYVDAKGKKCLTHDEIRGRVLDKGIVVDGTLLSFRDLEEVLRTREGLEIFIKIGESNE